MANGMYSTPIMGTGIVANPMRLQRNAMLMGTTMPTTPQVSTPMPPPMPTVTQTPQVSTVMPPIPPIPPMPPMPPIPSATQASQTPQVSTISPINQIKTENVVDVSLVNVTPQIPGVLQTVPYQSLLDFSIENLKKEMGDFGLEYQNSYKIEEQLNSSLIGSIGSTGSVNANNDIVLYTERIDGSSQLYAESNLGSPNSIEYGKSDNMQIFFPMNNFYSTTESGFYQPRGNFSQNIPVNSFHVS